MKKIVVAMSAFLGAVLVQSGFAQDLPRLSLDPSVMAGAEDPPMVTLNHDRFAPDQIRVTLYWENDGNWAKLFDQHDRHYTAGVGASVSWRALWVDHLLMNVPETGLGITGNLDYAMGLTGNLMMFTPEDFTTTTPLPEDRPFAGYTFAGVYFQRAHRVAGPEFGFPTLKMLFDPGMYSAFESLELDIGLLGPSSLAQNAQEMIHHAIDVPYPFGWVNQVHDEPEFSIKYNRRWRSVAARIVENVPITVQVIPEADLTVGSLQNQLLVGGTFRIGYNMLDDFGPGELGNPSDATGMANCACPGILDNVLINQSVYVFARPYGRFVAHNALLQGDNWSHDDVVTHSPRPAIFGLQCGVAWRIFKHFELAYMTTYESPEFSGQRGWDSWSSVQLSFSVAW